MWTIVFTKLPSWSKKASKNPYSTWEKETAKTHVVPAGSTPSSEKLKVPRSGAWAPAAEAKASAQMATVARSPRFRPDTFMALLSSDRWRRVTFAKKHRRRLVGSIGSPLFRDGLIGVASGRS